MGPGLEAVAHTLADDALAWGTASPRRPASRTPSNRCWSLRVTTAKAARRLGVLALDEAADEIVAQAPDARRQTLDGQSHVADASAVASMLQQFFTNDVPALAPAA